MLWCMCRPTESVNERVNVFNTGWFSPGRWSAPALCLRGPRPPASPRWFGCCAPGRSRRLTAPGGDADAPRCATCRNRSRSESLREAGGGGKRASFVMKPENRSKQLICLFCERHNPPVHTSKALRLTKETVWKLHIAELWRFMYQIISGSFGQRHSFPHTIWFHYVNVVPGSTTNLVCPGTTSAALLTETKLISFKQTLQPFNRYDLLGFYGYFRCVGLNKTLWACSTDVLERTVFF